MIDVSSLRYEGFEYAVTEIKKFIHTAGIFTMMLKNSTSIVTYTPEDTQAFMNWLLSHHIADIRVTG